jgi:putative spermidine/putrescine transport system permease protein
MHVGRNSWPLTILAGMMFVYLLAPVVMVFPLSLSNDNFIVFPPENWGIRYFLAIPGNRTLMQAFYVSVTIATVVSALCLLIAVPAPYALTRLDFHGRDLLMSAFTAPLLLPAVVLGLAMLLVFLRLNLVGNYAGLILAHLVITLPYALRVMATSLSTIPPAIEEAAATLGAHPLQVFRRVTLPSMVPGIVASVALTFLISFDEVVITLFIVGPQFASLPVQLFRHVESSQDPLVAAVSVVLIVITLLLVIILERSIGLARALGKADAAAH